VPEVENKKNQDFDAVTLDNNIILKSVEFSYDGGKSIFKPINSTINKGDKVAVIGPSGVGKSTLLDLISGLIKPTNGTIEIDSTDLSEIDQESWLQNFAYVPQEVLLMDTDINENISFKKELSDGELKTISSLIKELNLEKLVKDRHLFKVGNRGQNLSGGQRQRIAIARALFFKRDIIIMDEPTSALDGDNSQKILNLVFREFESKTIFVITHDSKLLQNFDKVIELNR
jgi:ABC-type bacteriocin/lantibiotic exporter with double-glycine peptidase domain